MRFAIAFVAYCSSSVNGTASTSDVVLSMPIVSLPVGTKGKQTPLPGKTEGEPQDDVNKTNEAAFLGYNA